MKLILKLMLPALLAGLVSFSNVASATDELGLFELDGNALDDTTTPIEGDDWDTVLLGGGGSSISTTGLVVDDPLASIFTQGGSKDILDISSWRWKDGSVPDKDDITHAYAAAYSDEGDLVVYVGADRFSNSGDAVMGLWLFQDNVSTNPAGTFDGQHHVGDVLAVAEFSNGGADVDIVLYQWTGAAGRRNALEKIDLPATRCGSDAFHLGCAITNTDNETSPWPYTPKSGTPGVFPPVSFFEGGFNISAMARELGFDVPCFSSFMVQSRSSTSLTAQLKDFVVGNFDTCTLEITKECTTGAVNATETAFVYDYNGTVTNAGFGMLYDAIVVDDNGTPADPLDDVETLVGDLESGVPAVFSGTFESLQNPPVNTARAFARSSASALERTVESGPASDECPHVVTSPEISISKTCWTYLDDSTGQVVVGVAFAGQVCNEGDIGLYNIRVTEETPDVTFTIPVVTELAAGACEGYEGTFFPSSGTAYSNTIHVEADAALGDDPAEASKTATCDLCPVPEPE